MIGHASANLANLNVIAAPLEMKPLAMREMTKPAASRLLNPSRWICASAQHLAIPRKCGPSGGAKRLEPQAVRWPNPLPSSVAWRSSVSPVVSHGDARQFGNGVVTSARE